MQKNIVRIFTLTLLSAGVLAGCDDKSGVLASVGVGSCTPAVNLAAVNAAGNLIFFSSIEPRDQIASATITGLGEGVTVVGMDDRPATGDIYLFGSNDRVYTLDITAGVGTATPIGAAAVTAFAGTGVGGFNFNPVPDRIRAINQSGTENVRIHPDTGVLAGTDTDVSYALTDINVGQPVDLRGMAYVANVGGMTTAYVIDANRDVLATLGGVNGTPSPNGGQLFTVGSLGVDVPASSPAQTFNIDTINSVGYYIQEAPIRTLRQVNLTTGLSKPCGGVVEGAGAIRALTILPPIS